MKRAAILKSRRGTTLVEAVCGLVILTLVVVTMYTGFVTAGLILREGDVRETNGQDAFASLEKGEASGAEDKTLTLPLGNGRVTFSGRVVRAGDGGKGALLYSFEASSESFVDGVRNNYIKWYKLLAENKAMWEEYGYPYTYLNNSPVRNFVRTKEYGGTWPVLSPDFLRRYLTQEEIDRESKSDGLLAKPVYVQPYLLPGFTDYEDAFVFAGFGQGDNWNTLLIYDHTERAWYYRLSRKDQSDIVGKSFAQIQAMIHDPAQWRKLV